MRQLQLALTFSLITVFLVSCENSTESSSYAPLDVASDVDAFVQGVLDDIGIPVGVGVAVFTNEGSYAQGFGVTDINTGEPATADTAFYIASSTKSVNALVMNALHHRGELDLDATLNEFAPDAAFPEDVLPDQVVLRDLLTHTSGISNNPVSFRSAFSGDHTPEVMWDLLAESSPNLNAPYGSFQYTNTGYNLLTILTDRKLGIPWQDLVRREIIDSLGMTRTTAYMSEAEDLAWQIARPHGLETDGQNMDRLYLEKVDATMQSAGGMVMSANDARLWLELFVNEGAIGGRQIFAPHIVQETRERLADVNRQFGDYLREDYGLGWYISSYKDELMIHHFGGFSGFRAHVSYLPERKIGVAVFVNNSIIGNYLTDSIANFIYDLTAGRISDEESKLAARTAVHEDHERFLTLVAEGRNSRAGRTWQLSQPNSAYVGTYSSPRFGTLVVSLQDGQLLVEMGQMRAIATPYTEPDTVRVELVPLSGDVLSFEVNNDNFVTAVDYSGERMERVQ